MICLQFRRGKFTVHVSQILFCCALMSDLKFLTGFLLKLLLGPLHMSSVDRAGSVTGMNFALDSYEKFQPGFRNEKRPKILGRVLAPKSRNKVNMAKHKNFNFRAYHSFGNS